MKNLKVVNDTLPFEPIPEKKVNPVYVICSWPRGSAQIFENGVFKDKKRANEKVKQLNEYYNTDVFTAVECELE